MADDKQLDRQQSYQQFHLQIYVTLASALLAASVFADKEVKALHSHIWAIGMAIACLFLAGIFGGIVTSKIPEATTYKEYLDTRIGVGFARWEVRLLRPKTWESLEHLCFWLAMFSLAWAAFAVVIIPAAGHK
jgi:hypothetical protein